MKVRINIMANDTPFLTRRFILLLRVINKKSYFLYLLSQTALIVKGILRCESILIAALAFQRI